MLAHRKRTLCRRGAAAVEMAVAFTVFIMFIFAVIEYGRFIMVRQTLENATREGARLGVVNPDANAIRDQVNRSLREEQYINPTVVTSARNPDTLAVKNLSDAGFGDIIVVQVNGTYKPLLPTFGFLPTTVNLQATSYMRCEK